MAEVLEYASPAPPAERKSWRPWGKFFSLLAVLAGEIAITVVLVVQRVELAVIVMGGIIIVTGIACITGFLACLIPTPPPALTIPERRIGMGRCARCGYDVMHVAGERCPECGWLIPRREAALRWPDPSGGRETEENDYSGEVEAYLREIMRYRPPGPSDRWAGDSEREKLAGALCEAFGAGNELNSEHFVPEDSFAVATATLGAHFAAMRILDRYLDDAFVKETMAELREMTVGQVVDLALASAAARKSEKERS